MNSKIRTRKGGCEQQTSPGTASGPRSQSWGKTKTAKLLGKIRPWGYKECRISWLTNSALVYDGIGVQMRGGGSQPMSTAVHIT
jgi:hypothetical protein